MFFLPILDLFSNIRKVNLVKEWIIGFIVVFKELYLNSHFSHFFSFGLKSAQFRENKLNAWNSKVLSCIERGKWEKVNQIGFGNDFAWQNIVLLQENRVGIVQTIRSEVVYEQIFDIFWRSNNLFSFGVFLFEERIFFYLLGYCLLFKAALTDLL